MDLQSHEKTLGLASSCLTESSLEPVLHELNEMDWKVRLSENKDRIVEHLIAFANHPNGGFLTFGINDEDGKLAGVDREQVEEIISRLTNLGRDAIEPPLILDHAVIDCDQVPLLCVFICEQTHKTVHRRGKSIEEAWIRSGGTTREASRAEIGSRADN